RHRDRRTAGLGWRRFRSGLCFASSLRQVCKRLCRIVAIERGTLVDPHDEGSDFLGGNFVAVRRHLATDDHVDDRALHSRANLNETPGRNAFDNVVVIGKAHVPPLATNMTTTATIIENRDDVLDEAHLRIAATLISTE